MKNRLDKIVAFWFFLHSLVIITKATPILWNNPVSIYISQELSKMLLSVSLIILLPAGINFVIGLGIYKKKKWAWLLAFLFSLYKISLHEMVFYQGITKYRGFFDLLGIIWNMTSLFMSVFLVFVVCFKVFVVVKDK